MEDQIRYRHFSATKKKIPAKRPDMDRIGLLRGMPLVPPTRLGFEQGHLKKVTYEYTDGEMVIWERVK